MFWWLAATTYTIDQWIWESTNSQLITNDEIKQQLIENNRFAMMDIVKNLLQVQKRQYWDANQEQLTTLKKLYLELEGWAEITYQSKN